MKESFINFLNALMNENPTLTKSLMTDEIQAFIDTIKNSTENRPELTENGAKILAFMQASETITFKARDIAEDLFQSSRVVSGALRKLVNDGFVEKMGKDPVIYSLTTKGKEYNIKENGQN